MNEKGKNMNLHDKKARNCQELEYMNISFITKELRVGIIGGGKGGYIKAKTFYNNKSRVDVLALDYIEEFRELEDKDNIKLIRGKYEKNFLYDKHIIVIAVSNQRLRDLIIEDCNKLNKIFINTSDYKNGMAVVPVQRESRTSIISVNTKLGNPKGANYLGDIILQKVLTEDDFIEYTSMLREKIKCQKNIKKEVLSFVNSNDFKYIWEKGKDKLIIILFYPELKEILR